MPPLLAATDIAKRFGGVVALDGAAVACEAGEIHALLGENGAGKSTMVKVLCGVQPPDAGEVLYDGRPIAFRNPAAAAAVGIVPVFQELSLIPDLSVAQNLFMGREPRSRIGLIDGRRMRRDAAALLAELGFAGINPAATVRDLPLAERQLVEIAKAVGRKPRVLILDEATSALTARQVEHVFAVVRRLRDAGTAVVFISHRMDEVRDLCDRATVFRDGTHVGTVAVDGASHEQIVRMMIGRALREVFPPRPVPVETASEALLDVRELGWGEALRGVSLTVGRGEIVGLAGLDGQGQGDLLFALFGVYAGVTGQVLLRRRPVRLGDPRAAMAAGLALVPEDRKTQGLILPLSVSNNVTLATLPRIARRGVVSPGAERAATLTMRDRLAIKTAGPEQPVRFLSGGNQQKVSIAKWLLAEPSVFLLHDPTRGIDVGAKQEIYALMRALTAQGHGVLFFSTDLSEIVGLCDRALVMYEGAVVRELAGDDLTDANLVSAAVGVTETAVGGGQRAAATA
ncbi:MAG: Ribose ABC transport system, ATP-binding protein RbsA [uncultured Thermomicrobiales bacterium]|uniref:Ribose ABC transport system, ATP-binding protein RbsA n=1 Tax=uncultured Thermomicrobiales bacterium TaxID=1645740 RepID=A0A6J4VSK5_9BACT|nr:MAG: Ribose ABC transport system, ATP-binding protein RbsA [uncultured Thermomicrobiales bacterium]